LNGIRKSSGVIVGYFSSSVGRKQVMGATGLIWSLFVLTHMAANMLILFSAEKYNLYSHALTSNPLLIVAELGLLATLTFHVIDGVWLTLQNHAARPQKYAMPTNGAKKARFQSKFMIFHGSLLLVFIILHLITFKWGPVYMTTINGVEMRDLHRLVLEVFQNQWYVLWYVVAMIVVFLHLAHGFYSAFASLGIFHPRFAPYLSKFGYFYAFMIAAGFLSQPIYVYFFANGAGH
jgi:succinate dehydrogenase / fumarate reductase cytochrome b subunit